MDLINFINKLTFKKVANIAKLFISYFISRVTGIVNVWGNLAALSVEPTNYCNLSCLQCPTGLNQITRTMGKMNYKTFTQIIDQTYNHLIHLFLYFQGEPFLNQDIFDMIKYAVNHNIYTATSTNGHFIDFINAKKIVESGLDKIIISLDGSTQDVYKIYRKKGDLNKVIGGIKHLIYWKKELKSKKPYLVVQFLVFKFNEHQINDVKRICKNLDVNKLELKTAQIYSTCDGYRLLPNKTKYSRYKVVDNNGIKLKRRFQNGCWKMWYSSVIAWNGDMGVCCMDKNMVFKFGNVLFNSISDIWRNLKYVRVRKKIFRQKQQIKFCQNCNE